MAETCEIVSACLQQLENTSAKPFWDLKSILAAIGISASLGWQLFTFWHSKKERSQDRKWSMFKEEIYTSFLTLLDTFESEVKPPVLPSQLKGLNPTEIQEKVGNFAARLSEIEVHCEKADRHQHVCSGTFQETYTKLNNDLTSCIGTLFSGPVDDQTNLNSVANAYSTLIDSLRSKMSNERLALDQ